MRHDGVAGICTADVGWCDWCDVGEQAGWVTDTWRIGISQSEKCPGMLCLLWSMFKQQETEAQVALSLTKKTKKKTSGEDLRADNNVVITGAKLELWMLNELKTRGFCSP